MGVGAFVIGLSQISSFFPSNHILPFSSIFGSLLNVYELVETSRHSRARYCTTFQSTFKHITYTRERYTKAKFALKINHAINEDKLVKVCITYKTQMRSFLSEEKNNISDLGREKKKQNRCC